MIYRFWLGLVSLITFLCIEALALFGYGILTDQNFYLTISDSKFLFVALLIVFVFLIWMLNVFLGSRRTIRNKRNKRSWQYIRVNWIMTGISVLLVPVTVLSSFGYMRYLDYPGLRPYEKAIEKGYKMGYVSGLDTLSRHGSWPGALYVAHAMGGINEQTYSLSGEAFELNYNKGFRVFELDFSTTTDGDIALYHLWPTLKNGQKDIPSTKQFMSRAVPGQFTPLMITDFIKYMVQHEDVWIVTDTKEDVGSVYSTIVKEAKSMGCEQVLDRFLIQFFDDAQYQTISSIYPFQNYIYGSYAYWDGKVNTFQDIVDYCVEHQIDSISMWNYNCRQEIVDLAHKYNLDVYVHSENNLDDAKRFLNMGVRGIYTDFIDPASLED